jgi:hypothetical protein
MVVQGDKQMAHKTAKNAIRVNTEQYEVSWGKKPRGYGYWWFQIGTRQEAFTGNYGEVIKNAKAAASVLGEYEIVVLP